MIHDDPSRFAWLATAAKYIGLVFTAGLGVIGTATDTKEPRQGGGFRLRPIGWIVCLESLSPR